MAVLTLRLLTRDFGRYQNFYGENMERKLSTIVAAAVFALTGGAASATTADFVFGGSTLNNQSTLSYMEGGVSLDVTGIRCDDGDGPNASSCGSALIDRYSTGIGMDGGRWDNHQVDGKYSNEFLKLSFSPTVTIESVSFTYFSDNDNSQFYTWTGSMWDFEGTANACPGTGSCSGGANTVREYVFSGTYTGEHFLIGSRGRHHDWKLAGASVTFNPIPLPAAGWMLLAGVGGLAAMKRRRKKADA
jgi:hypothetical protein